MQTTSLTKALTLGAALLAGHKSPEQASGGLTLALGAGKFANGEKLTFAAVGDATSPQTALGTVLSLKANGSIAVEGIVTCLSVTGNRALLKGQVLKPGPVAGKTFILNVVDHDLPVPSSVPDEAGLKVVNPDATCPGSASAPTLPFVQGDLLVWSSNGNSTPVANAGPDRTVSTGSTVTLDGSHSSDADGDPLTFAWALVSVPPGSTATLSNPAAVQPTFVADRAGSYVARLVVSDGNTSSAPDTVVVSTQNSAPVANAGPDQSAFVGKTVHLDGSGSSDADGDPLSYSWSLVSLPPGSLTRLSDPTAVTPTFVADRPGSYVAQLVVRDGSVSSAPDTVTVSTLNSAPEANAGPDQTVATGSTVTLDGSGSHDVDGDVLIYTWSLLAAPDGSNAALSDPTAVMPTFVTDRPGTYVAQLVVYDGTESSAPDTVTVSTYNSAPVADAGPDQSAFVGNTVTLDGSASSDVDGDPLTYTWSLVALPPDSVAVLSDATAVMPTFVADRPGTYVAQLIASDGTLQSAPDTVTISTQNSAPVANAGSDQSALVGATVTLDGSASSDVDGDLLTYSWSLLSVPLGSSAALSNPAAVMPTFVVDLPGTYVAQLIVNDGLVNGIPDTVTISTENSAPTANAGPDQTVFVGDAVALDGSASSDVDGDPLIYAWSLVAMPAGSTAVLSDPAAAMPSFVVDEPGTYVAQLIVSDGHVNGAPDTVTISTQNSAPVADAGPDQSVLVGTTVTLDGGGSSDVDGDPLTYSWSLLAMPPGSSAALSDPTAATPTFLVDRAGLYVAQLIVNDGTVNGAPDTVRISTLNSAPMADAGPDQAAFVGDTVTLDGSGSSDVDGDTLTFAWTLVSAPAGSAAILANPQAARPSFEADRPGSYVARLVVNDGITDSAPDEVTVTTQNSPPVANAGPDQSVFVGNTVTLDGSGSFDVDGDPLTYFWALSVPGGSAAVLSDPTAAKPTFVVDRPGAYMAALVVSDGTAQSAPDTAIISTQNSAPVANAGPDQSVFVTSTVTLDGSGSSDADGDALTYSWSLVSVPGGSAATLTDPTAVAPTFVVDVPGAYVAELVVNDGTTQSAPDTVTISTQNSAPVADAGPDQSAFVTNTVTLDGSGSHDVDGDPLTFSWSLLSVPPGSAAALSDPTAVMPTFVVDRPGEYVAQLVVNDGFADSAADTVTISTQNSAPVANAGADQTAFVTGTVTLDGSASHDVDGDPLTFSWSLLSVPPGSTAALSDPTAVMPTFVVDRPGEYVAQLLVNDGQLNSAPDTVTISTLNSPPVANAGPDQTAFVTGTVILDGSGSSDVDGDPLTFAWSLLSVPPGSAAALSDPTAVRPSFVVDRPGTYVAQLIVNDGTVNGSADTVVISTLNSAPVANAGRDQTAFVTSTVTLDGSGSSDVDGDALTYSWSLVAVPEGSSATLSGSTGIMPTFVVDRPGTYVAQLIVNDGTVNSAPDTVTISTQNSAPVANAGADQSPFVGNTVTLDGSGSSDVDGDALTYSWSLLVVPPGSNAALSDPTAAMPSFVVDRPGTYLAQLIVNDGTVNSAPDTVVITTQNSAPVANAGSDQGVLVGDTVTLDGSGSSDVDGDALAYAWSLVSTPPGSTATLSDPTAATPSFVADRLGGYVVELVVNDGTADSAPDTVRVEATLTLSLSPDPVTLTEGLTADVTLTLSAPAPAGGIAASLSTESSAIATAPRTATVPEGATSTAITITGVAPGSTTLRASAPGIPEASAGIQVIAGPPIQVASLAIGKDLQAAGTVSLGAPAPAQGVSVSLTSTDPTRVLLATSPGAAGAASISLAIPGGSSNGPIFYAQALAAAGSVEVAASAAGYHAGSSLVALAPSGFVISAPAAIDTTTTSPNSDVVVTSERLNPDSLVPEVSQTVRGGIIVNVAMTSSDTNIGTLTTSPLLFHGGDGQQNTAFDPENVGTTTINAETPPGFSTPSSQQQIAATVTGPAIILADQAVGKDLQVAVIPTLEAPAPAGGLTVTLASADAARVQLSTGATAPGSPSITLVVPGGATAGPTFYVQALSQTGSVLVKASATGYASALSTISLAPAGFIILTPSSIDTTTFAPNTPIQIALGRLAPGTLTFAEAQPLRGGLTAEVPVTSSDTGVGTLTTSPVLFNANISLGVTAFDPLNSGTGGTATVSISAPSGFSTPSTGQHIAATVSAPAITMPNRSVGKDLETSLPPSLEVAAPAGNLVVTITSGNPALLLVAPNATTPGGASMTLTIPAGATTGPSFFMQALAASGAVQVTASAPGYATGTSTATLSPSGFYIATPSSINTSSLAPNTNIQIGAGRLSAGTLTVVENQALRPGVGASVPVLSSDTNVGQITTSPVVFGGGDALRPTAFDPQNPGTATISVSTPGGFSMPSNLQSIAANVTATGIGMPNRTIGKDLQAATSFTLGVAAPSGGLSVTLTVADPTRALVSTSATAAGSPSVTVFVAQGATIGAFVIQALADSGTVDITATAPAYVDGVGTVTLQPSGFFILSPGNFTTTTLSPNTTLQLQGARLDPGTHGILEAQPLRGGSSAGVPVSSSDTSVGTITVSPVVFVGNELVHATAFDPANGGQTTIALTTPPGFTTPSSAQSIVATVTAPAITMASPTIGKDLQTVVALNLAAPAPAGGLLVTVASADPGLALVSNSPTTVGSPSIVLAIAAGATSGSFTVQALAGSGSVGLTATAPGFTPGSSTVTLNPSGFVISSPSGISTTTLSNNSIVTITSGRLSPTTLAFAQGQALRAGLSASVPVTSSDTNVGTITISPVVFNGNDTQRTTAFDPKNVGTTVIGVTAPPGFSTPSNLQQITATVTLPGINLNPQTIGKDLQVVVVFTLDAPAPAGGLTLTLASGDATRLLLSTSATAAGSSSILLTIPAGSQSSPSVALQALAGSGTVDITATAPGFDPSTSTATLVPSGFYIVSPGNFTTTRTAANTNITIGAARLNPGTLQVVLAQALRGGFAASVPVTSSNPAVGLITVSPVVFNANDTQRPTAFDPQNTGTAIISVTQPAGFSTPSNLQQITATVNP